MTDNPINPPYAEAPVARPVRPTPRTTDRVEEARPTERKRGFIASLDKPLLLVVSMLLVVGMLMVYSTTFDWSFAVYNSATYVFSLHMRNVGIGLIGMSVMTLIDYRLWRRLAVWILLAAIGGLIAVLFFADVTFGARRALIAGAYQPGELAEFSVIIYMAAWLGSKKTKIRSVTYGLIPFVTLVGIVGGLVVLQPDLSTATVVFVVSAVMFFLAGADIVQLLVTGVIALIVVLGIVAGGFIPSYAGERVDSFIAGITDLTQANYQTQEAINAFIEGGWTGVGLGEGRQKFGFLPAPHTDSIFAVIGEELGVIGASVVVLLYVIFVVRGFQVARRAIDPFGALLAAGLTVWVAFKALLNIAVMLALVPTSGTPLPFISYGGSSLVVMMSGVGLLLSVQRVTFRQNPPERRVMSANINRGGRNGRTRVSRAGGGRSDVQH